MSRIVTATEFIACSAGRIIEAFIRQEDLNGWWGVSQSLVELVAGGTYALIWQSEGSSIDFVSTGFVEYYEPGRCLRLGSLLYYNPERPILGPMELEIVVDEAENGAEVTVTQRGYREGEHWDWYYDSVKAAWPMALGLLKKYIESEGKLLKHGVK